MNYRMHTLSYITIAIMLTLSAPGTVEAKERTKADNKREKLDIIAEGGLQLLFNGNSKAKKLYDNAYGYAVFENIKISLLFTGGGGHGVAVRKSNDERIYMRMGTAGVNIGFGGQRYTVIFFFQDAKSFNNFVERGWQADASANAVGGTKGVNREVSFINGVAVYTMTQAGLMLQVDFSGTKYWQNKKLNQK